MSLMDKASRGVGFMTRNNDIAMVVLLVLVVTLMIVPLPTWLVDTLIGVNMTLSFLLLMMSMYVKTALDVSSFPTMLLFTTLFRVGLNITTTRLILLQADAGEIIYTFDSTKDCGIYYALRGTTILNRIRSGKVVGGLRFRYREDDEQIDESLNLSPKRDKGIHPSDKKRKYKEFKPDDVDLTNVNHAIVSYEVRHKRVCITRCTVLEHPQPFVGSVLCAKCPYFKGRNKKTHQVACSHLQRRNL